MKSTITYKFDEEDEGNLAAMRLTVVTMKIKDVGTHARLHEEAINQWRVECGLDKADDEPTAELAEEPKEGKQPEQSKQPTQEQMVTYNAYVRYAKCASATKTVHVVHRGKKSKDLDPDAIDEWQWEESSMAEVGLDNPRGVMDIKTDLLEAWERAVDTVNPGVFGRPLTSTPKKTTGVLRVT